MGIVGESGSGKTVAANCILRLLPPNIERVRSGRVLLEDIDLMMLPSSALRKIRGAKVGMVFQSPAGSLNPLRRVGSQLLEVLELHRGLRGREAKIAAAAIFADVGLSENQLRHYPHELSGGMQQRVSLAIAVSCHPRLLIADEPTSALDVSIQRQIIELIQRLVRERKVGAVLFITHDFGLVDELCDAVTVMYAGQVAETGTTAQVLSAPQHPYTRALLAAIPRSRDGAMCLAPIDGVVPTLLRPPTGCRFRPRCAQEVAQCSQAPLPIRETGTGHLFRCVNP